MNQCVNESVRQFVSRRVRHHGGNRWLALVHLHAVAPVDPKTNFRMEVTEKKMAMVWRQMLLDCQTRTNAEGNTEVRVKA